MKTGRWLIALWLCLALVPAGCSEMKSWLDRPKAEADDADTFAFDESGSRSSVMADSIGEATWVEGLRLMHVAGYGLVVGLGDQGSADCPRDVRNRLLDELYKRAEFRHAGSPSNPVTPEIMIDDPDTAVVQVEGHIPAGAVRGSPFDVTVSALPGTQTTSLRGGWLYTCNLNVYRMLSGDTGIRGRDLAEAEGPVFLNPFANRPDAATRASERVGQVIGGGSVTESRRMRLVLYQPSYSRARAIAGRINTRFGPRGDVADATSPSYVDLTVPDEFRHDPKHFIALVQHLYLPRQPGFADRRARELAEEIVRPNAAYADIALAWEGIGRTVLPTVSALYSHADRAVRLYAAMAGLYLGDDAAVEVIAAQIDDLDSPHRFEAIKALGQAESSNRAARPLRRLLDDADSNIRVAAYEALVARGDREIETHRVGERNFLLDLVTSESEPMIYIKRSSARRIAIFGKGVRFHTPVFFRHPSGELTVNAFKGDRALTILCNNRRLGEATSVRHIDPEVASLVARLGGDPARYPGDKQDGLAVSYGAVVQLLHEMCELGSIDARFMLEKTPVAEIFGPPEPESRRESELE